MQLEVTGVPLGDFGCWTVVETGVVNGLNTKKPLLHNVIILDTANKDAAQTFRRFTLYGELPEGRYTNYLRRLLR